MPRDTHEMRNAAEQTVVFKTKDGAELVGQLYLPPHPAFAIVVLNGEIGARLTGFSSTNLGANYQIFAQPI